MLAAKCTISARILADGYADQSSKPSLMSTGHMRWTVGRTGVIGNLITAIKCRRITFPSKESCGEMLSEIRKETA